MLAPAAAALVALLVAGREPGPLVVIDPGHGGEQEGALSPRGAREKDLALQISRRLAARLRRDGIRVVLTRTADLTVPLAARAEIANAIQADLFVSVHLNSMPTAEARRVSRGVETYFLSADASDAAARAVAARENADRLASERDLGDPIANILSDLEHDEALRRSSRLAQDVHRRLVAALGAEDRGVRQAPFFVLAGARMPAVLVEVGFISHAAEAELLASRAHQDRIAGAIADGIATFRGETRHASR